MELGLNTPLPWRSPEGLVGLGFARAPMVLMNEAHDGLARCVRTRTVGWRILPTAHAAGVRHLAMEALEPAFTAAANRERKVPPSPFNPFRMPPGLIVHKLSLLVFFRRVR